MADGESQGIEFDLRSLDGIQVGGPACSKVFFTELDEWLSELKLSLEEEPRELVVRVTRSKSRREGEPICDVFAIAGFHAPDGCLNELVCQSDDVDELGAFKLLDGTKEAIEKMGQIRQGLLSLEEELGVSIQIRGGRFEN